MKTEIGSVDVVDIVAGGTYLHKRYKIALLGVFPIKEIIQNISMRLQELLNPSHHPVLHLICQTPLSNIRNRRGE